jgi:hypothetical protein
VAKDLSRDDMRRFARLGALRRLEELRKEEAAIREGFPELFRRGSRPADLAVGGTATRSRKPYRMSPEAKKAVSERMKKYWAERRKAKR